MSDAPDRSAAAGLASAKIGGLLAASLALGAGALALMHARTPAEQKKKGDLQTKLADAQQRANAVLDQQKGAASPGSAPSPTASDQAWSGDIPVELSIAGSRTSSHKVTAGNPRAAEGKEHESTWREVSETSYTLHCSGVLRADAGERASYSIVVDEEKPAIGNAHEQITRSLDGVLLFEASHVFDKANGSFTFTASGKDQPLGYAGSVMGMGECTSRVTYADAWSRNERGQRLGWHMAVQKAPGGPFGMSCSPFPLDMAYVAFDRRLPGMDKMPALPGNECHFLIDKGAFDRGLASGKPFTVQGAGSVVKEEKDEADSIARANTQVLIRIGGEEWEAVLLPTGLPDNLPAYSSWLPEGPRAWDNSVADDVNGNTFALRTVIRDKKSGKERSDIRYKTRYELSEVSSHKGCCGNYPKGAGEPRPDLVFLQDKNQGCTILGDGATLETGDDHGGDTVTVTSRDFASFAKISAEVIVASGPHPAVWIDETQTKKDVLALPRDDNGNHIADAWEKSVGIYDRNLSREWDDEDQPGNWPNTGDGISLEDEYRGLVCEDVDPKDPKLAGVQTHNRLDPRTKKILVFSDDRHEDADSKKLQLDYHAIVRGGARIYQQATGIHAYMIRGLELVKLDQEFSPPIANPNTAGTRESFAVRVVRQAGLNNGGDPENLPKGRTPEAGVDPMSPEAGDSGISTDPSDCAGVFLAIDNIVLRVDWYADANSPRAVAQTNPDGTWAHPFTHGWFEVNKVNGVDPEGLQVKVQTEKKRIVTEYAIFTVGHELCHATGAGHHRTEEASDYTQKQIQAGALDFKAAWYEGSKTCLLRYWDCADKAYDIPLCYGFWSPSQGAWVPTEMAPAPKVDPMSFKPVVTKAWKVCGGEKDSYGARGGFPKLKPDE